MGGKIIPMIFKSCSQIPKNVTLLGCPGLSQHDVVPRLKTGHVSFLGSGAIVPIVGYSDSLNLSVDPFRNL